MISPAENSWDSLRYSTPDQYVQFTFKITRVFPSLLENACLIARDSRHDCNLSIHYLEGFHVDGLRVTALLGALGLVAPAGTVEAAVGRLDHEHVGVDDVGGVLAGRGQVVVDRDLRASGS